MKIKPGLNVGPYIISKNLGGHGGMSDIWLAEEKERGGAPVVIKFNNISDNKRNVYQEMLRRETALLPKLRHPGIVHIYPIWMSKSSRKSVYLGREPKSKVWYYSMEYIKNGTLKDHLKMIYKKFPIEWSIELIYQLLMIVHYLHLTGFGHCDLKPENIMFREKPDPNSAPQPVLIDFGSAVSVNKYIEMPTTSKYYSPPEIIRAIQRKDVGAKHFKLKAKPIDVWALGAIYYEVLTGRRLITFDGGKDLTTSVVSNSVKKITKYRKDASDNFDTILHKMLETKPEKRPTVSKLIEAFDMHIQDFRPPRIISG